MKGLATLTFNLFEGIIRTYLWTEELKILIVFTLRKYIKRCHPRENGDLPSALGGFPPTRE